MLKTKTVRHWILIFVAIIGTGSLRFLSAGPFTISKADGNKKQSVKELRASCGEHAATVVHESQQLIVLLAKLSDHLFAMLCDHVEGASDGVLANEKKELLDQLKTALENLSNTLESCKLENDIKEVLRAYNKCLESK